MEIVYRSARASVEEIRAAMPQAVGYSGVRRIVNVLEHKGHLRHEKSGKKYVYRPSTPRARAVKDALQHLLGTYFGGSMPRAVAALVHLHARTFSDEQMKELIRTIETSRKGRRA